MRVKLFLHQIKIHQLAVEKAVLYLDDRQFPSDHRVLIKILSLKNICRRKNEEIFVWIKCLIESSNIIYLIYPY